MMLSQLGFIVLVIAMSFMLTALFCSKQQTLFFLIRSACILILMSFLILIFCFLINEFSIVYVLRNSSTLLPWYYRLCAVWGGHEGSVLLWVSLLALWTLAVTFQSRRMAADFSQKILQVLLIVFIGLLSFIIFTSNPFQLQFVEMNAVGKDLNPLLQDPGFLLHPPLLYLGYVGFAVPFAFAMAALGSGHFAIPYLRLLRPWVLLAWSFLTFGICLGSWWAYRELGWGGFWFWDPVENASLMPWLVGTALLHAVFVSEKQQTFLAWTILLAVSAFALSLIGTFLVRSGILTSVHAFAVDPKRGLFILIFLVCMMTWAYGLYIRKASHLFVHQPMYFFSRESGLLMNNILLFIMMFIVLLGTLYPLIVDGLGFGKLSVGAPYFNTVMQPILAIFLLLMGFGIHIRWRKEDVKHVFQKLILPIFASLFSALLIFQWSQWPFESKIFFMLTLSLWIIFSLLTSLYQKKTFPQSMRYWAMWLAHFGFAIMVIGVIVSTGLGVEKDLKMKPDEKIQIAGHQVEFIQESEIQGPNYHGSQVQFTIDRQKDVFPQKRIYNIGQMVMTDAAVDATLWRDIYLALGEPIGQDAWAVRVYFKPLIRFIWLGGLLMGFAGLVALYHYRRDIL